MSKIKAIRNDADYEAALARIESLMDSDLGTNEGEELDVLVDLVELYETKRVPMGYPSVIEAIRFRMEQGGLTQRDLMPFIGSRAKVSEVLAGKRQITMQMARALHEHLGIPAEVLLRPSPAAYSVEKPRKCSSQTTEWERFPIQEMAKRGWIPRANNTPADAKRAITELINRAGCDTIGNAFALYRKSDRMRTNSKADPYALKAWCLYVLAVARGREIPNYRAGTVTVAFLRQVAKLSWNEDGPKMAKDMLEAHGIRVVVAKHLPRTYLDGAALKLCDGSPVVGLTLRYDRIDNFWFCLLHELAHVGRHIDANGGDAFVDDLSLRSVRGSEEDSKEQEADSWAEDSLIPEHIWKSRSVTSNPTPMAVVNFAKELHVHPAIVAGRVRYETKNYRLLSHFVGTGEVRKHFDAELSE